MPVSAVITLPDGRRARITGPTREAVQAQAQALAQSLPPAAAPSAAPEAPAPAPEAPGATAGGAFRRRAGTTVANSVLAAPSATGDLIAGAAAGVGGIAAKLRGEPAEFGRRYEEEQQQFPASAIRAIPRPKVESIAAGIRSAPALLPGGETPGEAYARNREAIDAENAAMREAHPVASMAGDIAGGAATIALGRTGAIKSPVAWASWGDGLRRRAETGAQTAAAAIERAPPGVLKWADDVWNSKPVQALRRGAGRAGETGFEGAALAAMNSDDPLEMAAWGAGAQATGSMLRTGAHGLLSGGLGAAGMKVAAAAVAAGSITQLLKEALPGERERILESLETGYEKIGLAIVGGIVSTAAGFGRVGGSLEKNLPVVADAITSLPRNSVLTMIRDLTSDDPRAPAANALIERLQANPEAFGSAQLREINRAINDGRLLEAASRIEAPKAAGGGR